MTPYKRIPVFLVGVLLVGMMAAFVVRARNQDLPQESRYEAGEGSGSVRSPFLCM